MKAKIAGKMKWGVVVAAAAIAVTPLMAQATPDQAAEIASLKRQIYECHHHKRHHHRAAALVLPTTVEKQTIIEREKPVIVEKVVEKQVTLPPEKEIILEKPMEVERKVVVEHAAHHKHLLHLGIPFIGVNLF